MVLMVTELQEASMSNRFVGTLSKMVDGVASALLGKPEPRHEEVTWSQDRVYRIPRS
jgi:hypothetical protein